MYHFYILFSRTLNRYYIGSTEHIERRVIEHNYNHKGFTGKVNDWKLIYSEIHATKSEAYARERQVKKWKSRTALEKLIVASD